MSGPIRSIAWDADNSRIIAVGQGKEKFGHAFSWDSVIRLGIFKDIVHLSMLLI